MNLTPRKPNNMDPKTSPAESMMAFMEASDFLLGPNLNGDYMTDVENVDGC